MKKRNHFHQYEKFIWPSGNPYYKCMIPGCKHYLVTADLVIGRESLCHGGCNKLVTITKEMIQKEIKKPMCENCRNERAERKEILKGL